jgi:hypothetical protein
VLTDLDTLTTARYVEIDDHLPRKRRMGRLPKLSDAELVTLAVAQAMPGITSESRWLHIAATRLAGAFPYLPGQPPATAVCVRPKSTSVSCHAGTRSRRPLRSRGPPPVAPGAWGSGCACLPRRGRSSETTPLLALPEPHVSAPVPRAERPGGAGSVVRSGDGMTP